MSQSNVPQQIPEISVEATTTVGLVQVKDIALPEVSSPIVSQVVNREGGSGDYIVTALDRWVPVKSFMWKKDTTETLALPSGLTDMYHLQRVLPSWTFWRADFEVEVHVNATKFHTGQLAVGYLYDVMPQEENLRISKQTFCNMPGSFVYASSNNVVKLDIPFQHIYPYRRTDDNKWLNVYFKDYVSLRSGGTAEPEVPVTIYVRCRNVHFGGLRAKPEMLSLMRALVRGGESALKEIGKDLNRDNPVDPSNPVVVISRSSQSWCAGQNYVENLNVLRLDVTSQHSHRTHTDEMQVSHIVSRFGRSDSFIWSTSQGAFTSLFSIRVTPFEYFDNFVMGSEGVPVGWVPAVGAISSLFTYWRGTLEFRIDLIASAYHTGKLGVRFIPGKLKVENKQAYLGSYGEDFSLDGVTSLRFAVPFVSEKSWLRISDPSRTTIGEYTGRLVVFVINPLVNIDGVSKEVEAIVHIRGGPDFELAVPNVPILSLPFELKVLTSAFFSIIKYAELYLVFGTSADKVSSIRLAHTKIPSGEGDYSFQIIYPLREDYDMYSTILTAYPSFWPDVVMINNTLPRSTTTWRPDGLMWEKGLDDEAGTKRWKCTSFIPVGNVTMTTVKVKFAPQFEIKAKSPVKLSAEPEAGEEIAESMVSLNVGTPRIEVFNENFNDLKNFCRRYNFYTECLVRVPKGFSLERVLISIPIYPDGLELDVRSGSMVASALNLCRHAPISVLCNAFKYFRGGLRFKIVARATNVGQNELVGLTLSYSHVPDVVPKKRMVTTFKDGGRQFFPSGYAQYVQNVAVNEIVELEIPYYAQSEYTLMGRCDANRRYDHGLGIIAVSSKSEIFADIDLALSVYWSFADDARFFNYQGFSKLALNPFARDNVAPVELGDFEIVPVESQTAIVSAKKIPVAKPEAGWFENDVNRLGDEIQIGISSFFNKLEKFASPFLEKLESSLRQKFEFWLSGFIGQMSQVLLNPCIRSVAIAVTTLVVQLGQIFCPGMGVVSQVSQTLIGVYQRVVTFLFPNQHTRGEEGVHNNDVPVAEPQAIERFDAHILGATLVSALATIFGMSAGAKQHGFGWVLQHLRKDLHGFAMTSNALVTFFSNNLSLLSRLGRYFASSLLPGASLASVVHDQREYVESFLRSVDTFCDPLLSEQVRGDVAAQQKVFELNLMGDQLSAAFVNSAHRSPAFDLISGRCAKIKKLMSTLVRDAVLPGVKYEPFVIHIVGPPKIGKSRLVNELAVELLSSIGYMSYEDAVYTKTPGNKHWNCLRAQPVLLIDDFYFSEECGSEQCQALFCLKSAAAFNPEQAELDDKKRFYAPKIVIMCGNDAFPRPSDILCPDALYRRRDILVSARLTKGGTIESYSEETLDRFEHLEFSPHDDPRNRDKYENFTNEGSGKFVSYAHWIKDLKAAFKSYNTRELSNVRKSMSRMGRLFPPCPVIEDSDLQVCRDAFEALQRKLLRSNQREFAALFRETAIKGVTGVEYTKPLTGEEAIDQVIEEVVQGQVIRPEAGEDEPLLVNRPEDYELITEKAANALRLEPVYDFPVTRPLLYKKGEEEFQYMNVIPTDNRPYSWPKRGEVHDSCQHATNDSLGWIWDFENEHFIHNGLIMKEERCCRHCAWDDPNKRYNFYFDFAKNNYYIWAGNTVPNTKIPKGLLYNDWILEKVRQQLMEEGEDAQAFRIQRTSTVPIHENILPELEPSIIAWLKSQYEKFKWWGVVAFTSKLVRWLGLAVAGVGAFFLARSLLTGAGSEPEPTASTSTTPLYPPLRPMYDVGYGQASTYTPVDKPVVSGGIRSRRDALAALKHDILNAHPEGKVEDSPAVALLRRNFGILRTCDSSGKTCVVRFLGIVGNYLCTVAHVFRDYVDKPTEEHWFEISIGGSGWTKLKFDVDRLYAFRNSQLCVYRLPVSVPAFKDLRKHMASIKDHARAGSEPIIGYVGFTSDGTPIVDLHHIRTKMVHGLDVDYGGVIEYMQKPIYQYAGFSAPGLCGSVLFDLDPKFRIYGLHVAGTGKDGFAEPIVSEMFANCSAVPQCEIQSLKSGRPPVRGVLYLGTLQPSITPVLPRKSKIIESTVHGEIFPPTRFPAPLVKRDPERGIFLEEDPLFAGVAKHGKPPLEFPEEVVSRARDDLAELLCSVAPPILSGADEVLSDELVFSGIPGKSGYTHLQLGTSEGFPLVLERPDGFHDKRWLFDFSDTADGRKLHAIAPNLREIMDANMSLRKKGIVPPTVFQDCLKDSRIPKEKLHVSGATRVFSVSPVEFTFAVKKYYAHFAAAYARARPFSQTAIGINPNGPEWSQLYRHIAVFGTERFVTGDYKAFGDRLQSQCIIAAFEIMDRWYEHFYQPSEETRMVRRIIREELLHVPHVAAGHLYRMFCGIPSGFALTVEINSLINCLYMRIVWQLLFQGTKLAGLDRFNQLTRVVTYGDDLLISVHSDAADFNFVNIKEILASFDIEFTSAIKTRLVDKPFENIKEINFLKRTFEKHEFRHEMMAPLDKDSVCDCVNWIMKTEDKITATLENLRAVNEMAYSLGRTVHDEIRLKLMKAWSEKYEEHLRLKTWREIDDQVWGPQGWWLSSQLRLSALDDKYRLSHL